MCGHSALDFLKLLLLLLLLLLSLSSSSVYYYYYYYYYYCCCCCCCCCYCAFNATDLELIDLLFLCVLCRVCACVHACMHAYTCICKGGCGWVDFCIIQYLNGNLFMWWCFNVSLEVLHVVLCQTCFVHGD